MGHLTAAIGSAIEDANLNEHVIANVKPHVNVNGNINEQVNVNELDTENEHANGLVSNRGRLLLTKLAAFVSR